MSCCAIVIDSLGNVHYGYESGLTDKKSFIARPEKARTIKTGETLLTVGSVRAGVKFVQMFEKALGDLSAIPKEDWWMDEKNEWEAEAILIDNEFRCFHIEGPEGMFPITAPGYYAIGSGGDAAFGVLWHLLSGKKNVSAAEAKKALYRALEAACACDDACSLPITIETLIP